MTPTIRGSRAAIYIRISKDQQNSALQRDELPVYCAGHGWQVIETYEDQRK
jgi:DNA invertase Pin-like site-specific DNA recombinase